MCVCIALDCGRYQEKLPTKTKIFSNEKTKIPLHIDINFCNRIPFYGQNQWCAHVMEESFFSVLGFDIQFLLGVSKKYQSICRRRTYKDGTEKLTKYYNNKNGLNTNLEKRIRTSGNNKTKLNSYTNSQIAMAWSRQVLKRI